MITELWISVKEKMPDYLDFVLTYNSEGAILIGRLYSNGWTAFFADGEKPVGIFEVSHWMPLPEPPKD